MGPVGPDLLERGAAEHSAAGAGVARAFRLVIAVEEIGPAFVEAAVAVDMVAQDEGLEKPCGVREVPLGGRGIGEGLYRRIGVAERRGEIERQLAGGEQPLA